MPGHLYISTSFLHPESKSEGLSLPQAHNMEDRESQYFDHQNQYNTTVKQTHRHHKEIQQEEQQRSALGVGKRIHRAGNKCFFAPSSKSLLLALLLAYVSFVSFCAANETRQHPYSVENNFVIDPETAALIDTEPAHHSSLLPQESSNQVHVIEDAEEDCVKTTMDEGIFHYKSRGSSRTCGLYLISDPNKLIVVTIEYLNVLCQEGGLISVVDGWELNGAVFPSYEDHEKSISSRFHDLCVDSKPRHTVERVFASSQNAVLIQYRIPMFGKGFSVRVEHVPNPQPCNVLVQDIEGVFTLENYGRNVNCSLMTIFDAKIRIMYMNTGLHRSGVKAFSHSPRLQREIYHKCAKMGAEDFVQLGGSSSLDTTKMEKIDELCGLPTSCIEQAYDHLLQYDDYSPRLQRQTFQQSCGRRSRSHHR